MQSIFLGQVIFRMSSRQLVSACSFADVCSLTAGAGSYSRHLNSYRLQIQARPSTETAHRLSYCCPYGRFDLGVLALLAATALALVSVYCSPPAI